VYYENAARLYRTPLAPPAWLEAAEVNILDV
jgi:hypothetical protein